MVEPKAVAFEDAQWIDWPLPTKGMSKDVEQEVMPLDFWSTCKNAFSEYGITIKTHGFEPLQAAGVDLDLGAPVMLIAEVEDSARFPHIVVGTAQRLWTYDPDNDILTPINRYDEGTIAVVNGSDTIVGTNTHFLEAVKGGDIVTVDDGGGGTYTGIVSSVNSDTELVLTGNWTDPTDLTVDLSLAGNYIEQLFSINGIWDWDVYQGGDPHPHIYLTNGVDPVMRYGGEGDHTHVEILGGNPPKAYFVNAFREFIILGYLTDNGSGISLPYGLAWCVAGQPTNWSGGEQRVLSEGIDAIVGMARLSNRLIIHREDSQSFLEFRGGTFIFYTGELNREAGGIGKRSTRAIKGGHIVIGNQNIFLHSVQDLHNLGDMTVQQWLLDNIKPEFVDTVQILSVPNKNRAYIFFPSTIVGGNYCDKCLVFNTLEGTFVELDAPSVTTTGKFREYDKVVIDDIHDIIDTVTTLIDAQTLLEFLPIFVVGCADGKIYTLSGLDDFDETTIQTTLETGQDVMDDPNRKKHVTIVRFDIDGPSITTTVNFYLGHKNESHDDFTWTGPYVVPLTGVTEIVLPTDAVTGVVGIVGRYWARRFVVTGVGSNFELRKMSVFRNIEGEY